jgi:hypothetical protein
MGNEKQTVVPKPDEFEYMQRVSQLTNPDEIKKAREEYKSQCEAYFDWMSEAGKKGK